MALYKIPYRKDERKGYRKRSLKLSQRLNDGQEKKDIYCPNCNQHVNHFHHFPMCRLEKEISEQNFFSNLFSLLIKLAVIFGSTYYLFK